MALDLAEARKWLDLCGACYAGLPRNCTCPKGDIRTVLQDALAEVERLRRHSITLNSISWRIAAALGDVPDGADSIEGDPGEQADRLIAEVQRLRAYAETTRYHQQQHAEPVREVERLRAAEARVRQLAMNMAAESPKPGPGGFIAVAVKRFLETYGEATE